VVDVAMGEAALRMTGDTIALKTALGVRQERAGGAWPVYPISLTMAAADGRHVELSAQSQEELDGVVVALGLNDEEHRGEAATTLAAFTAGGSAAEVVSALRRAGACCSVVNSVADLFEEEHVWARGNLMHVLDPELGEIVTAGIVPTLSRTPGRIVGWSRRRGSENEPVLGGLLGYPERHIAILTRPGGSETERANGRTR